MATAIANPNGGTNLIHLPNPEADKVVFTGSMVGAAPIVSQVKAIRTRRSVLIDPPDSAVEFAWDNSTVVLPGQPPLTMPAIGTQVAVVSFQVPQKYGCVIRRYANGSAFGGGIANWRNGDGNLVWQILKNGIPFKNFKAVVTIRGLIENGGSPLTSWLRATAGDIVTLALTNVGVVPAGQNLLGLLEGYYYPQSLEPGGLR